MAKGYYKGFVLRKGGQGFRSIYFPGQMKGDDVSGDMGRASQFTI